MKELRELKPEDIGHILQARMEGKREKPFLDLLPPDEAGPEDLVFFWGTPPQKGEYGGIVVKSRPEGVKADLVYFVEDPRESFFLLLEHLSSMRKKAFEPGVDPLAHVHPTAKVEGAQVGAYSFLESHVVVGKGTVIHPMAFIGDNTVIGENCQIFPFVFIGPNTLIGDRVTVHAGSIIGADGFGFRKKGGEYVKIPQLGRVVIEDDCEIGANTCVDRATIGETRVKRGTKLDNLIQVAHNVEIGENTVIAAQSGIAGSSKIGSGVLIGGQVGVADHIRVGDGSTVTAQAGVSKPVPPGAIYSGHYARERSLVLKAYSLLYRLPELFERLRKLEDEIGNNR